MSEPPRLVAVVGPTGVGKSALAMRLARALGSSLVNLDSVQMVRGLNVASAKPSAADRRAVEHYLFDVVDPDEPNNVGLYLERARPVVSRLAGAHGAALAAGGTGLYLRALVHGLLDAPPPSEAIRAEHRARVEADGAPALHAELARVDPKLAARVHPNDAVRASRGLEVFAQTGRRLSDLQREHEFAEPRCRALKIALWRPRSELNARLDERVERMVEAGALDEARLLFELYPRSTPALGALGYRQMGGYIVGELTWEETIEEWKRQTRRYAKQQIVWLRTESDVYWVDARTLDDPAAIAAIADAAARHAAGEPIEESPAWASGPPPAVVKRGGAG